MNIVTTTKIYDLFKQSDEDTILRKRNIRGFIKANNVNYHQVGSVYAVDLDSFLKTINPKGIDKTYSIPKLRTMASAVREFNKTHTQKIDHHIIEKIIKDKAVPFVKTERLYLINYVELEKVIIRKMALRKRSRQHY